jgi:hypothetical protein
MIGLVALAYGVEGLAPGTRYPTVARRIVGRPTDSPVAFLYFGAVSANLIAHTSDRANQWMVITGIYFPTQLVNIDVDDVGHGVEIELPHLLDNRGSRHWLSRVAHQKLH